MSQDSLGNLLIEIYSIYTHTHTQHNVCQFIEPLRIEYSFLQLASNLGLIRTYFILRDVNEKGGCVAILLNEKSHGDRWLR